jgi:hypothetical protein
VLRSGDNSTALPVYLNITNTTTIPHYSANQTVTFPAGSSSQLATVTLGTSDASQKVVVRVLPDPNYNVQPNDVNTADQVVSIPLPN